MIGPGAGTFVEVLRGTFVSAPPVDVTLPTINNFVVGPQVDNQLPVSFDLVELGSLPTTNYYVAVSQGSDKPSPNQMALLRDASGASAPVGYSFQTASSGEDNTTVADPPGRTYDHYLMAVDTAGNRSVIAEHLGVTYTPPVVAPTIIGVQGHTTNNSTPTFTDDLTSFQADDLYLSFMNVANADEAQTVALNSTGGLKINLPLATTGVANLSAFSTVMQASDVGPATVDYVLAGASNTNVHGSLVVRGGSVGFVDDDWERFGDPMSCTIPAANIASSNNLVIAVMSGNILTDDTTQVAWGAVPDARVDRDLTSPARGMAIAVFEGVDPSADFVLTGNGNLTNQQAMCLILINGS